MIITSKKQKDDLLEAGKHLREVLDTVREHIKDGVMRSELNDIAEMKILQLGDKPSFLNYKPAGHKYGFPATACVSVNDEMVHGVPSNAYIHNGDLVSIDCGLIHKGVFVDAAFTVVVGESTKEKDRLVEATRIALQKAIDVCRAGARVGDIGNAVENVSIEYGYSVPVELGGHGVGAAPHEEPFIPNIGDKGTGEILRDGEIVALEPIFTMSDDPTIRLGVDGFTYKTKDNSLSAHFEHTVLITKNTPVIVTGHMW